MKKLILLFVLSWLSFSKAQAQTWEKATYNVFLKEFTQLLQKQPESWYSTTISTSVYMNVNAPKAEDVKVSKLSVYGPKDYVFQSGEAIQIQHEKLKIDIDTVEKQVLLSKAVDGNLMGFQPEQFDNIDSTKYEFYFITKGNRKLLKVVEKIRLSSMQSLIFEFDKTKNELRVLEMLYWPSNYSMNELGDQTDEQPLVRLEYSSPIKITTNTELDVLFNQWLLYNSKTKVYSCPDKNYTFYDLLNSK